MNAPRIPRKKKSRLQARAAQPRGAFGHFAKKKPEPFWQKVADFFRGRA